MKERVADADTKVTVLVTAATAKYIRVASEAQDKTQSKFVSDVLERYGEVKALDMEKCRTLLKNVATGGSYTGRSINIETALSEILSIFGIEEVTDG